MTTAIRKHLRDFVAVLALIVLAAGTAAYILANERLRFPLVEEKPLTLQVVLPDAQAVTPGQGQTVRVAGVEVGLIGRVGLEDGRAVVDLDIEPEYKGLVRADATALLRPKTGLKDMFIEIDPGDGRPLGEGGRIPVGNTAPDVDPDEVLSALDSDTRAYLKLLITGAGKGLAGRGSDLREALARLGPLHRDLAHVTTAVARRRRSLRHLVHNYGLLVAQLGDKDHQLTRLVQASNATLGAFASEDVDISRAVGRLPGALRETQSALVKVDPFARELGPTLQSLRPAVRNLDEANHQALPLLQEGEPILREQVRPFVRVARPLTEDVGHAAARLRRAGPDLTGAFHHLNRFFNIGAHNPGGSEPLSGDLAADRARNEGYLYWLGWVVQNTTNLFNVQDAHGPLRRITLGGLSCGVLPSLASKAGYPPEVTAFQVALFGGIGACAK